ncbi:MAG: right-handed parallel beta-helix repeat-containing protein [Acidobacteriota bacterium]
MTKVSTGGEVVILDSGDYDSFTISKAVSVEAAPGVYAGITTPAGHAGVTVNVGTFDVVGISGLTLRNGGAANNGITVMAGGLLTIEHCVIDGFAAGDSINVQSGHLDLRDSTLRGAANGIHFFAVCSICSAADATIDHCRFENNGSGVLLNGGGRVTVRNSVATQNGLGMAAQADVPTDLNVENCLVAHNRGDGIRSVGATTVRVSNSVVTDNAGVGLFQSGEGFLLSRRNNTIEGNGVDAEGVVGFYTGH